MKKLPAATAILLLFLTPAFSQSSSATLSGTVTDSTGGVVPGALVAATNIETGVVTTAFANSSGVYNFASLQPGLYKVSAEQQGFQTATRSDLRLVVNSQVRLNFQLEVAGVATQIEVISTTENLVLEASSSTGTVLPERTVTELPLVSNDVMDLINVMGGVIKAENPIFENQYQTFAGVPGRFINIQRDGITVNEIRYDSGIVSPIRLNPEMVGEFRMVLSPVDAELGRGAGQVQVLTRSGSNQFHGSATWNFQNTALDANEFSNNRTNTPPAWRNLNNYTVSASGPIIENKTFFFAVWDQQIVRSKTSVNARVLTPCARKGIFRYFDGWINGNKDVAISRTAATSATRPVVNIDGNPILPTDTWDGNPYTGQLRYYSVFGQLTDAARAQVEQDLINCSAYNISLADAGTIPGTNWDIYRNRYDQSGFISRFTALMPDANNWEIGDGLNTAGHKWTRRLRGTDTVQGSGMDNERKSITFRIDHNFSASHRIGGTYTYESNFGEDAYAWWPNGFGGSVDRQPQSFSVYFTSALRPTLLNEARFGLSRTRTYTNEPLSNPETGEQMRQLLDSLMPTAGWPDYSGFPIIVGPGSGSAAFYTDNFFFGPSSNPYGSMGNLPSTWGGIDPRWTVADTLTWTKGSHSFKGGFELRLQKSWQESNGEGGFFYSANTFPSVQGGYTSQTPPAGINAGTWTGLVGTDSGTWSTGNVGTAYGLLAYMAGSIGNIRQYYFANSASARTWNDATAGELFRVADLRQREYSIFFKDDWKVNNSLTLNLGLRYEYYGIPWVDSGMTAGIKGGAERIFGVSGGDLNSWMPENPVQLGNDFLTEQIFIGPNSPNPDIRPFRRDTNNFGPAVGFAWQLPWFGKDKTTLRGGYQLNYLMIANSATGPTGFASMISNVPGTVYNHQYTGDSINFPYMDMTMLPQLVPTRPYMDPAILPLAIRPLSDRSASLSVLDPNIRNPYIQSLTLSVTRNIKSNLTVDVRYIGTLSRKLVGSINLNSSNFINNKLIEAFNIARAGGESPLLDQMIRPFTLWFGASGAEQLRTYFLTSTNLTTGNYSAVASTLATTNGLVFVPPGVNGSVLRASGTAENFIYTNPQFSAANWVANLDHSNYHSMQAQVTLRPAHGLSFQTTYTWSRNLGASSNFGAFGGGYTDPLDRAADYRLSSTHRSHQLSTYGTYELPFGPRGFFLRGTSGVWHKIVEGWRLGWIASVTSGMPGSIGAVNRLWGNGNPDFVGPEGSFDTKAGEVTWEEGAYAGSFFGDRYVKVVDPQCAGVSASLYYTCAANLQAIALADDPSVIVFQHPQPGQRGNFQMNSLTGPGRWSFDLNMGKTIEFMEGKSITIRIDAENIFNHPTPSNTTFAWNARFTQIYNPNFDMNNSDPFGYISSKGGHRTFQAKVRLNF